ncbi:MAG: lysozyme inhibitor LprI family protein [Methylocystis sp.]
MTTARISRLAALFFVAWLGDARSFAQDCPDQTQTGLNQCAADAYAKADEALNRAYREIAQKLKGQDPAAGLLVKTQKSWLAFRDSECAFSSSSVIGGSIYPMIYSGCLEALTVERTKQLRNYLKCEEGDLSCPVPRG